MQKGIKMTIKLLGIFLLFNITVFARTYIFVDLSKGMTQNEFQEIKTLSAINKINTLYKNKEKVYLYALFQHRPYRARPFIYFQDTINEEKYTKAKNIHENFFKKIEKYTKIPPQKYLDANIIFLVDRSKKMHNDLEEVKQILRDFVARKTPRAKISIVTFDGTDFMPNKKRSHILMDSVRNKRALLYAIDSIKPSLYNCYLGSGLEKAKMLFQTKSKRPNFVVLFSNAQKIDDYPYAKKVVQSFKNSSREIKVVPLSDANLSLLQEFSTSGLLEDKNNISTTDDEIILQLHKFLQKKKLTRNDKLIIYSTMENQDYLSNFSRTKNIDNPNFYTKIKQQNEKNGITFHFHGAKVYVRIVGETKNVNIDQLHTFWRLFFKDAKANLLYFSGQPLTKEKLE